jgi:hypothetical protein
LGQTTWGSLVCRHCGQTLRGGTDNVHALARRLRLFAFEVFFFGTAMIGQLSLEFRWRSSGGEVQVAKFRSQPTPGDWSNARAAKRV